MVIFYFLVNVLFIFGIHFVFSKNQILGWLGDWLINLKPSIMLIWMKPFFLCPMCMPSIWGTLGYWLYVGDRWDGWIIYVFSLTGFIYLIKK